MPDAVTIGLSSLTHRRIPDSLTGEADVVLGQLGAEGTEMVTGMGYATGNVGVGMGMSMRMSMSMEEDVF